MHELTFKFELKSQSVTRAITTRETETVVGMNAVLLVLTTTSRKQAEGQLTRVDADTPT
jgi:hypothetical protein